MVSLSKTIVLLGDTSAGKDTLMNMLLDIEELNLNRVVSHTTRPKREGEVDGVTYHFVSNEKFRLERVKKNFIETRSYNTIHNGEEDTWHYGLHKDSISEDGKYIAILDGNGTIEFMDYVGRENVIPIYIKVDEHILRERLKQRGDELAEVNRRLKEDKIKFNKFLTNESYYIVENNSHIENALSEILAIIHKELM